MADLNDQGRVRVCSACKIEKPATPDHYGREKRTLDNCKAQCRECERAYLAAWRAQNPGRDREYYEKNKARLLPQMREKAKARRVEKRDEVLAVSAAWREKNREKVRQYQRKYFANNRESELARIRGYYAENPDKWAEKKANGEAWRRANRDQARSYVRNRRAKLKAADGTHAGADIERLWNGQKGRCWWCSTKLTDGYHVDHRIPISRGGSNGPENLVISCAPCNLKKNDKMPWEMTEPRLL
jgi:5-methylcytosine-specific restriction endonuclease McrA